jgi:hypothetical protein
LEFPLLVGLLGAMGLGCLLDWWRPDEVWIRVIFGGSSVGGILGAAMLLRAMGASEAWREGGAMTARRRTRLRRVARVGLRILGYVLMGVGEVLMAVLLVLGLITGMVQLTYEIGGHQR